jgi:hypothetical protein
MLELPLTYLCFGMVYGGLAMCAHRSCYVSTYYVNFYEHLTYSFVSIVPLNLSTIGHLLIKVNRRGVHSQLCRNIMHEKVGHSTFEDINVMFCLDHL